MRPSSMSRRHPRLDQIALGGKQIHQNVSQFSRQKPGIEGYYRIKVENVQCQALDSGSALG